MKKGLIADILYMNAMLDKLMKLFWETYVKYYTTFIQLFKKIAVTWYGLLLYKID